MSAELRIFEERKYVREGAGRGKCYQARPRTVKTKSPFQGISYPVQIAALSCQSLQRS